MIPERVRIATRRSALAVWQAETVAEALRTAHPGLEVELVRLTTSGDRIQDRSLVQAGGKGLFVKELEQAMLDGTADLAVHSLKDVPATLPEGLHLSVVLPREDPRDALVAPKYGSLAGLPDGARVGTSSLRRRCQLRGRYPTLAISEVRGNVDTRLRKLDEGQFDAIVLAAAGLTRLGLAERISEYLDPQVMLPAIGQGVIVIECRSDDETVNGLLQPLGDETTTTRVTAERAFNARLGGSCHVPIAGFAELGHGVLLARGLVGDPEGEQLLESVISGRPEDAEELGTVLAEDLLGQGAGAILQAAAEP